MAKYLVVYRCLIDTDKAPDAFAETKPVNMQYILDEQVQELTDAEWQRYKKLEREYKQESRAAEKEHQGYLKRKPGDY